MNPSKPFRQKPVTKREFTDTLAPIIAPFNNGMFTLDGASPRATQKNQPLDDVRVASLHSDHVEHQPM